MLYWGAQVSGKIVVVGWIGWCWRSFPTLIILFDSVWYTPKADKTFWNGLYLGLTSHSASTPQTLTLSKCASGPLRGGHFSSIHLFFFKGEISIWYQKYFFLEAQKSVSLLHAVTRPYLKKNVVLESLKKQHEWIDLLFGTKNIS